MGCREFGARLAWERSRQELGTQKEFGILVGKVSTRPGEKRGPAPEEGS
jgi:hypothetical protein